LTARTSPSSSATLKEAPQQLPELAAELTPTLLSAADEVIE
jgi:hypothetical protein